MNELQMEFPTVDYAVLKDCLARADEQVGRSSDSNIPNKDGKIVETAIRYVNQKLEEG
jgi:hypothetical protein